MTDAPRNRVRTFSGHATVANPGRATVAAVVERLFPVTGSPAPIKLERLVTAPQGTRQLSLQPKSWNAEARTLDVVWTTGARGARFSFDTFDVVDEELATAPGNVRLDRLNRGAPVLNTHQSGDLGGQIGIVVPGTARMTNGEGIATIQLSARDDLAPIVADIAAGIIRNLSVGYAVHVFEVDPKAQPRPLYRAVDWEPTEISFVPVPFDAGAQVRDLPHGSHTCLIRTTSTKETKLMSMTNWISRFTGTRAAPPVPPALSVDPAGGAATEISYSRQATIPWLREYTQTASELMDLPSELCADLALEIAERSLTEGQARDAVMAIVAERQRQATSNVRHIPGGVGNTGVSGFAGEAARALASDGLRNFDNPHFHARAIEEALFARMSGTAPTEAAREFMNMSMVQIAGDLAQRRGLRDVHRMNPTDVLNAAAWNSGGGKRSFMHDSSFGRDMAGMHTTSDFPELLLGAGERFLLTVFQAAASPLKQISRQRTARDFRALTGIQLSGYGTLDETLEDGEIKYGTFKERKETYRLKTFTKGFALSRQAIINDDLGVFSDPMIIMARAAAETEATLLADLINSNPRLSDNLPLFSAAHGNLAAVGGKPTVATLDAGRMAMRSQKDLDGRTPIAPAPKYIVSGIDNETTIEQMMTALQTGTSADANPFAGKLTPAVDPRLDPRAWFLFGDPLTAPTLEYAYLNEQTGPKVEMQDGWDVLGTKFRVYMDFGAGAVDHRGAYKNPGEAIE
ncbi:hypothetical protein E5673_08590 [Sphingomonas sp. PAMC26645]|uniref:prohead protease/major capsid protein fusion protein n=1 Tax=Sphingomonas sp. PAMC26645 TaxID=2565555 RepID=UPI00109E328A|nr:prohead protease/major capsid protein fusion protein [Sphingomonas sp. PAMC26645]QCB42282.1 hypothetical protein E5673_08590 [Sphingomonas sp. PAMC26645]